MDYRLVDLNGSGVGWTPSTKEHVAKFIRPALAPENQKGNAMRNRLRVAHLLAWLACSSWLEAATTLTISKQGQEFCLEWQGAGILETADSVQGPWKEVPGAVSPHKKTAETAAAYFRIKTVMAYLNVTTAGTGKGSVVSQPAGIECGTDCSEAFLLNTLVTLTALPEAGSVFEGWSGACTGTGAGQVVMDANKSVTATFGQAPTSALVNGDFEQGPSVGWTQQPGPLIYRARDYGVEPYSGDYVAYLGYESDNRHVATLSQRVTLPSTFPLYLNLAIWLYSEELCDVGYYDWFGFYIGGQAIVENARLCRGNTGGDGWRRISLDISAYAGQNVVLAFQIGSNSFDPLASWALLDALFLSDQPWE